MIKNASFIMLMGGEPFKQKEMCEKLGILEELKRYDGIMLEFSAGAMLMSKYIIITPCSEEYPGFHIDEGLNEFYIENDGKIWEVSDEVNLVSKNPYKI